MNHSGVSLGDFFRAGRDRGEPLVLATVARTLGSTYRKAGAQMLIAGDGRAAGLLSGGCLESDLMERARTVLAGTPVVADYDTRSSDDVIWGIGLGCEGAMTILMTRLDRANDYQPFAFVDEFVEITPSDGFESVTLFDVAGADELTRKQRVEQSAEIDAEVVFDELRVELRVVCDLDRAWRGKQVPQWRKRITLA